MQDTLFGKPEDQSAETAAQLVAHVSLKAMAQHESLARAQAFERHRLFRLLVGELVALFAADSRARVTLGEAALEEWARYFRTTVSALDAVLADVELAGFVVDHDERGAPTSIRIDVEALWAAQAELRSRDIASRTGLERLPRGGVEARS